MTFVSLMKIKIGTKYNLFHMINFCTMVIYQKEYENLNLRLAK